MNKDSKVYKIHKTLIVLIIVLVSSLLLEFKLEKDKFFKENKPIDFQEQKYIVLPEENTANDGFVPSIDLFETDSMYIVNCDLPGMKKDMLEVSISNNCLVISGNRDIGSKELKHDSYRYSERKSGVFSREIMLPGLIDEENVKAQYNEGILTIKLPKKVIPQEKVRIIEII